MEKMKVKQVNISVYWELRSVKNDADLVDGVNSEWQSTHDVPGTAAMRRRQRNRFIKMYMYRVAQ